MTEKSVSVFGFGGFSVHGVPYARTEGVHTETNITAPKRESKRRSGLNRMFKPLFV